MSKVDLDRFNDFMVEYKKEVVKDYEEEIERLNNIINEIDFYVYERMRDIWVKAEGDIDKATYKELVSLYDKIKELKGDDKDGNN